MNDLITLQEAAALIGKNLRTIQRYIKNGELRKYEKEGKNFVSRQEIEQKFGKFSKKVEQKPPQPEPKTKEKESSPERLNYEVRWIDEIQKHAQTREELGIWKGRAEAYQAFASRLLGTGPNGVNEKIDLDQINNPEIKKVRRPSVSDSDLSVGKFRSLFLDFRTISLPNQNRARY